MMGRQEADQAPLLYTFNLEDQVLANHLLRGIDQFLGLNELHRHLALLIRMLILGYSCGIRSERWLCERGAFELGLPLVLSVGPGRRGAGPFDVLEEPA